MTFADRVSVWFFLLLGLVAWLAPWVRQVVERRRGIASPARSPRWDPEADRERRRLEIERAREDLLPPAGDWCGCCGRDCPPGEIWCARCAAHVTGKGQPHEQTWYATHDGEDCPYADHWDGELPPGVVEETRLMPNQGDPGDEDDNQDQVAEGLGFERPRVPLAAQFPKLSPAQLAALARRRAQEHTA